MFGDELRQEGAINAARHVVPRRNGKEGPGVSSLNPTVL
jgi:hypothetical protein